MLYLQQLEEIGLSDKEAKVYVALLKIGRGTAYRIAKVADVKTPTTYLVLDDLLKKGLAFKIPYAKGQMFVAKEPTEYLQEKKNKLQSFESILPQIMNLRSQQDDSKIVTFDGHEGLKDALNYKINEMRGKTFYSFYSDLPKPDEETKNIYLAWNKKAHRNNIHFKIIAPKSEKITSFVEPNEEIYRGNMKLIDVDLWSPDAGIEIGDGFVRVTAINNLQVVLIDNKAIANAMKQIFDMVWNSGVGVDYKK